MRGVTATPEIYHSMRVGPGAQIRVAAGWGWRRAPAILSGRGQTQKHSAPSSAATRLLSGTGWVGSGAKEHPMMYSPRAQRFVPLSTKQVAAAVWNRTVQPYRCAYADPPVCDGQ